jgi:ATP-dependent protease Clp ATPase subunit
MGDYAVRCGFCGNGQDAARMLVPGPAIFICDQCLGAAANALATREPAATAQERLQASFRDAGKYCSFCGKSAQEASCLLHRSAACICDECIRVSLDIIVRDGGTQPKVVQF